MTIPVNIVHESDVQRQYVRVQLPLAVKIDGREFTAIDWSNGGVALEWPEGMGGFRQNQHLKGILDFPFSEFDMTLPVEMEVRYVDSERRRLGCRFVNLTPQQLSMLQYFVSAYISGEVVRVGDVIDVASRNHFTAQRKIPAAEAGMSRPQLILKRAHQRIGTLLISLLGLLLLGYVLTSLYERMYVVKASGAQVDADTVILRVAGGGGIFYQPVEPGTKVQKGTPLVMVSTDNGTVVSLDSPCDCIIVRRTGRNYDRVKAMEGVLDLVPVDGKTRVSATVPYDKAVDVAPGQKASLKVGGRRMKGKVTSITASNESGMTSHVVIAPDETIAPDQVGGPVDVRIDTF